MSTYRTRNAHRNLTVHMVDNFLRRWPPNTRRNSGFVNALVDEVEWLLMRECWWERVTHRDQLEKLWNRGAGQGTSLPEFLGLTQDQFDKFQAESYIRQRPPLELPRHKREEWQQAIRDKLYSDD